MLWEASLRYGGIQATSEKAAAPATVVDHAGARNFIDSELLQVMLFMINPQIWGHRPANYSGSRQRELRCVVSA